jgi:hypothetical protein
MFQRYGRHSVEIAGSAAQGAFLFRRLFRMDCYTEPMADSLYLSLWFSGFEESEMLPNGLRVMQQFPWSKQEPGITDIAVHPVSWNEPTILERRFRPGVPPEQAVTVAFDLLHDDYAYVFVGNWDAWTPQDSGDWTLRPNVVRFIVRGERFEDGEAESQGHVQVDFGLDSPFLHEEMQLTPELEKRVQANVQMLVDFIGRVEKNCEASTRLLWSESDENLAQKLITRLQKVQ